MRIRLADCARLLVMGRRTKKLLEAGVGTCNPRGFDRAYRPSMLSERSAFSSLDDSACMNCQ